MFTLKHEIIGKQSKNIRKPKKEQPIENQKNTEYRNIS